MLFSFKINYFNDKTELCEIGKKYDTDKSSQRINVNQFRHCHPYTIFYHSIFKNYRNDNLNIAEIGIGTGGSLLMWNEYFTNSTIYGFDNNTTILNDFKTNNNNNNNNKFVLSYMDVSNKDSITSSLHELNATYDIIIDDTTHNFDDQLRIIENVYSYLKPGGILIIENVFKMVGEHFYFDRLKPILDSFQEHYFITLDHVNRESTGWDNDKLLVLVKNGAKPIFKNEKKKITIITPSYRSDNLIKLKKSINFSYVNEWIIVYDGNRLTENPYLFKEENNEKIKEYIYKGDGISGNPQRNFALDNITITDTYLYYLDDDNIIHNDLYKLLDIIDDNKLYTFNQKRPVDVFPHVELLRGNKIELYNIDTAMMLIDFSKCKNIRWLKDLYNADGYYIKECYENNKDSWIFIDNELSYYNKINYC